MGISPCGFFAPMGSGQPPHRFTADAIGLMAGADAARKRDTRIAKSRAGRPACFLRAELSGMALFMLYGGVELDIAALTWVTKARSGLLRALYLIYRGKVLPPRASLRLGAWALPNPAKGFHPLET